MDTRQPVVQVRGGVDESRTELFSFALLPKDCGAQCLDPDDRAHPPFFCLPKLDRQTIFSKHDPRTLGRRLLLLREDRTKHQ